MSSSFVQMNSLMVAGRAAATIDRIEKYRDRAVVEVAESIANANAERRLNSWMRWLLGPPITTQDILELENPFYSQCLSVDQSMRIDMARHSFSSELTVARQLLALAQSVPDNSVMNITRQDFDSLMVLADHDLFTEDD